MVVCTTHAAWSDILCCPKAACKIVGEAHALAQPCQNCLPFCAKSKTSLHVINRGLLAQMLNVAAVSDALTVETPLLGTWYMVMCTLLGALTSGGVVLSGAVPPLVALLMTP